MKRIISLLLALLLSLSAVCCAAAEGVTFKTAYFTLTLPKDWAVDYEDAGVDEDGGEYLGCFYSTDAVGIAAYAYLSYFEDWKDVSLWNADEAELREYADILLKDMEDYDPELIGIVMAGKVPFVFFKGVDEDGPFFYAETMTNGYAIAFDAYVVDEDFNQRRITDKHIEQFENILATFQPVT